MSFVPSRQQKEFFDWVSDGEGNAILEACAGSGKTTTLVKAAALTTGKLTFTAFNKKIAEEIKRKIRVEADDTMDFSLDGRVHCATFHSLGFGMLRRAFPELKNQNAIDEQKRKAILLETCKVPENARTLAFVLLNLGRQAGLGAVIDMRNPALWAELIEHFGLEEQLDDAKVSVDTAIELAQLLMWHAARPTDVIDYNDMLWLPLVHNLSAYQTPWLFVDEAQDTNVVRRELAKRVLAPGGRAVFVGDPAQAIYGFTGADSDALELIAADFDTWWMPLTVSYRCPRSVVKLAQQWVPRIEAAPTAQEGEVIELPGGPQEMMPKLAKGDVVLCRNTAPLVSLALSLIRQRKRAHVEGRDIGRGLLSLTNKWPTLHDDSDAWVKRLSQWRDDMVAHYIGLGKETSAEAVTDKFDTIAALAENATTVADIRAIIESIFDDTTADDAAQRITLSTIHKSKGREWPRVFWYQRRALQPSKYARQEWQHEQERNLMYVAATRAQQVLFDVH